MWWGLYKHLEQTVATQLCKGSSRVNFLLMFYGGLWRHVTWCWKPHKSVLPFYFLNLFLMYLAALGLSCSLWCVVPLPGIEPGPSALGVQSLSHWTTRDVPWSFLIRPKMGPSPAESWHSTVWVDTMQRDQGLHHLVVIKATFNKRPGQSHGCKHWYRCKRSRQALILMERMQKGILTSLQSLL